MKITSSIPLRFTLLTALAAGVISLYGVSPLHAASTSYDPSQSGAVTDGGSDDGGGHDGGDDHGGGGDDDHGKNEFLGTIQSLPATAGFVGTWTVDTKKVLVSASTVIRSEHGLPTVGGKVEVEGILLADGSIQASRIKTEDKNTVREDNVFYGKIEALPASGIRGSWKVAGLVVLVTNTTRVETEKSAPAVGLTVRVEGTQQADASIVAKEILIQDNATLPASVIGSVSGLIQKLPATAGSKGNWLINNRLVTVSSNSKAAAGSEAMPKAGMKATINGRIQINGTILVGNLKVTK